MKIALAKALARYVSGSRGSPDPRDPDVSRRRSSRRRASVSKLEIGTPSGFQHIGHVAWDPETGFTAKCLAPDLITPFQEAGINADYPQKCETSLRNYRVIKGKRGTDAARNEGKQTGIRRGVRLRKVEPRKSPLAVGGWDLLLVQIRQGCVLRSVSDRPQLAPVRPHDLATELWQLIQRRSHALRSSGDDENEGFDEEWEE